jgi:BioD-like phosphotransacetylase family protein
MSILVIASSEPRVGRSLIAAAVAYRIGRAGTPVTLARLGGDESAAPDAAAFAALDGIVTPGKPIAAADIAKLSGDVILEAPAGSVKSIAGSLNARVITVGDARSAATDAPSSALAGTIVTRVPAADVAAVGARAGVLAVLPEDRTLAAPSVSDVAAALKARWLAGEGDRGSFDQVMIGTVSSDAGAPYFGNRARTCVITRFDKTDVQLAALQTDIECLVITGGGEPSPYLLDRVRSTRDEIAVLLAPDSTVETMRAIEGLYAISRFEGNGKLARAVELLDEAAVAVGLNAKI